MRQRRMLVLVLIGLTFVAFVGIGLQRYSSRLKAAKVPRQIAEGVYSAVSAGASTRTAKAEVNSFTLWSDPNGGPGPR